MNIIDPVLVVAIPIILSFIYIQLVSGFLSDVFIARITKASFKIASSNIVDLWIGYVLGMLVFVYIVHQFVKYNVVDIDPSSRVIVIIIGLTLLYIGRIITKEKGIFYGRLHFSSLFILGSIFFVLNSIIMLKGLSVASIMYYNLTEISSDFLNRIKDTLIFFQSFILYMFIGTIMLSTVGEYLLYRCAHEQPRSLLAVSEKFPSDFRVITGKRGIRDKSNEMVAEDKEIISLRCVTKSCTMVRDIEEGIRRQYEKQGEREGQEKKKLDYRIIT